MSSLCQIMAQARSFSRKNTQLMHNNAFRLQCGQCFWMWFFMKTAKFEIFPEKSITAMMNDGCSFALSNS
jgi:hypothetical protein